MAIGKVINKTQVYFGPNTIYPSNNSYVGPNDTVTILWAEGSWYYIEYPAGSKRKRMYIRSNAVSSISGLISTYSINKQSRYCSRSLTTFTGPSNTIYTSAGSLEGGEEVKYLYSRKENNYALIEYSIGNGKKKRAWVDSMNLTIAPPILILGKRPANMYLNSQSYKSSNMYYNAKLEGQCTWFCWGRAHEKTGNSLTFRGPNNGGQWYDNINTTPTVIKRAPNLGPVSNCICSCSSTSRYGHVIFVESVIGNIVYYTEANTNGDNRVSKDDGIVKSCSSKIFPRNRKAYGYIVLK